MNKIWKSPRARTLHISCGEGQRGHNDDALDDGRGSLSLLPPFGGSGSMDDRSWAGCRRIESTHVDPGNVVSIMYSTDSYKVTISIWAAPMGMQVMCGWHGPSGEPASPK